LIAVRAPEGSGSRRAAGGPIVREARRNVTYGYYDTGVIVLRNELFRDDALGMLLLRRLKELQIESVDVIEAVERQLIDYLGKYRRAIIVYSFDEMAGTEMIETQMEPGKGWSNGCRLHSTKLENSLSAWLDGGSPLPEFIKVYGVPRSRSLEEGVPPRGDETAARTRSAVNGILQTLGMA
jgi:Ni,Fe-hydrogenase maturation factor